MNFYIKKTMLIGFVVINTFNTMESSEDMLIPEGLVPPSSIEEKWSDVALEDSQSGQVKEGEDVSRPSELLSSQRFGQSSTKTAQRKRMREVKKIKQQQAQEYNRPFIEWAHGIEQAKISQNEAQHRAAIQAEQEHLSNQTFPEVAADISRLQKQDNIVTQETQQRASLQANEADHFATLVAEPREKIERKDIIALESSQREYVQQMHDQEERLHLLEHLQRGTIREDELAGRLELALNKPNLSRDRQAERKSEGDLLTYDEMYEPEMHDETLVAINRKDRFSSLPFLQEQESEGRQGIKALQRRKHFDLEKQKLILQQSADADQLREDELLVRQTLQQQQLEEQRALQRLEQKKQEQSEDVKTIKLESQQRNNIQRNEQRLFDDIQSAKRNASDTMQASVKNRYENMMQAKAKFQAAEEQGRKNIVESEAKQHSALAKKAREGREETKYLVRVRLEREKKLLEYMQNSSKAENSILQFLGKKHITKEFLLCIRDDQTYSNLVLLLDKAISLKDTQVIILLLDDMTSYNIDATAVWSSLVPDKSLFQKLIGMNDVFLVKKVLDAKGINTTRVILSKDKNGLNALMIALYEQNLQITKELLKKRSGIDYFMILNAKDNNGWTAFMRLVGWPRGMNKEFQYQGMQELLKNYPGVNWGEILTVQEAEGFDVLLFAVFYKLPQIVELLMQERPGLHLIDFVTKVRSNNYTPLSLAQYMYKDILKKQYKNDLEKQETEALKKIVQGLFKFLRQHRVIA